jgi:hypothetical protein
MYAMPLFVFFVAALSAPLLFHVCSFQGTLDALLCADDAEVAAAKAVSEISRVLVSGGVFVMVSHAAPEHREPLLKVPSDGFIHYQVRNGGNKGRKERLE